jgi:hypothetical protein
MGCTAQACTSHDDGNYGHQSGPRPRPGKLLLRTRRIRRFGEPGSTNWSIGSPTCLYRGNIFNLPKRCYKGSYRTNMNNSILHPGVQYLVSHQIRTADCPAVLDGFNSSASLYAIPSSTFKPDLELLPAGNLVCKITQDHILEGSKMSVVRFVSFASTKFQLQPNAPPPRLHYSTFWRSVSKRIYDRNKSCMIVEARAHSQNLKKRADGVGSWEQDT